MRKAEAAVVDPPVMRRAAALPPDERRAMIVEATLPLLLTSGEMVTTRQIADAAGIAEGTIFRVFADKDALIAAVVEAALDMEPLERELAAIDQQLPFEACLALVVEILQRRVVDVWRLLSSIGTKFHDRAARPIVESGALVSLLAANQNRLAVEPTIAARVLRNFTLSVTHPMLVGEPMSAVQIVQFYLHGVCARESSC